MTADKDDDKEKADPAVLVGGVVSTPGTCDYTSFSAGRIQWLCPPL